MTQISDRDRLLRTIRGENLDGSLRYSIYYSLDIRGNITIWGGMSFYRFESIPMIDDPRERVSRNLVPIYEYHRLSPYTARIFQMEQEIDESISDDKLIEELTRFRAEHPEDGLGGRRGQIAGLDRWSVGGDGRKPDPPRCERDDKQQVLDRLMKQERRDILNLWGVDCPPDINSSENYGRRLSQDRGQVSDWFEREFIRIGGDWDKLWGRR